MINVIDCPNCGVTNEFKPGVALRIQFCAKCRSALHLDKPWQLDLVNHEPYMRRKSKKILIAIQGEDE